MVAGLGRGARRRSAPRQLLTGSRQQASALQEQNDRLIRDRDEADGQPAPTAQHAPVRPGRNGAIISAIFVATTAGQLTVRRLPGRLARVTGCTGLLTGLAVLVGALLFPGLAAFIAASVISALSLKFGQRNVGPSPNDHYVRRQLLVDLGP